MLRIGIGAPLCHRGNPVSFSFSLFLSVRLSAYSLSLSVRVRCVRASRYCERERGRERRQSGTSSMMDMAALQRGTRKEVRQLTNFTFCYPSPLSSSSGECTAASFSVISPPFCVSTPPLISPDCQRVVSISFGVPLWHSTYTHTHMHANSYVNY